MTDASEQSIAQTRKGMRESGMRFPVELASRSVFSIATSAALPFAFIGAAFALARYGPAPWYYLLPVHFALLLAAQRCMQTLVHDSAHRLFSGKSLAKNDLAANFLAAGWIGSTVAAYRDIHFRHHAYNGSEDDPEHIDFELIAERGGLALYCLRYATCMEAWRLFRKYYWPDDGPAEKRNSDPERPQPLLRQIAGKSHVLVTQALLAGACVWVARAPGMYVLWLYLAVSWSPMLSGLRFLVEHPGKSDLTVTTRSWPLERLYFAPYNFNYHFEHHLWPAIPPYRLRQAHAYLRSKDYFRDRPQCLNDSYLGSLAARAA